MAWSTHPCNCISADPVRRPLRVVLLGVVAFVIALLIVFPAGWLAHALPAGAQCANWSGSLWRGQCSGVTWTAAGRQPVRLDSLSWHVHPLALLRARLQVDTELSGAGVQARGKVSMNRGGLLRVEALSATGQINRSLLGALPAGWNARLEARDVTFELQGRTLQELAGTVIARELTDERGTRLGDYQVQFPPQPNAPFAGTLRDLGGPIELKARLTIKADRGWTLDGAAKLRPGSPPQLAPMLDQFNTADISGQRRILLEGVVN
jgi:hypothetical protein